MNVLWECPRCCRRFANRNQTHTRAPLGLARRPVEIIDGLVRRPLEAWTHAVHGLLRHLESIGFEGVPRAVAVEEDRDAVTFVPGEVGHYPLNARQWSEEAMLDAASWLRRFHDATASYRPVGLIDFDTAGPGPRIWDVAYAAYRFVPLVDHAYAREIGMMHHDPSRRLALFCNAYGLENLDEVTQLRPAGSRLSASTWSGRRQQETSFTARTSPRATSNCIGVTSSFCDRSLFEPTDDSG